VKDKYSLKSIFEKWANEKCEKIITIPQSGSYREYYRLVGSTKNAMVFTMKTSKKTGLS
jgi:hypothetical protein